MKKLCIFDFDGTLFDSIEDVAKCFDITLNKFGFTDSIQKDYINSLGGNINQIVKKILANNATEENIRQVKKAYEEIYNNHPKENTIPYHGMKELLIKLERENRMLAINSNRNPESIKLFINKHFDNINFIDIQGHVNTHPSKPNPYGVNIIMEKAGVSHEETLYIGDSSTDIKTAQNANIDCVLVDWGYGFKEDYENDYPLKIVSSADELNRCINSL